MEARGQQVKHEVESLANQLDTEIAGIDKQRLSIVSNVDRTLESVSQYGNTFNHFVASSDAESKSFAKVANMFILFIISDLTVCPEKHHPHRENNSGRATALKQG